MSNNFSPLGDLSVEEFLAEYWQKKPLLIPQALPGVVPPIAADELAGLACEEQVESRLIIHDGSSEHWDLTHGPFAEETFRTLPENHWTLLVQAVDFWVPEAAKFLDQFSFIPSWRVDDLMISLSGDGGGVGPHFDNYDVFLVQVSGRRQWEVGGVYDGRSPRRPDTPVMILTDWKPKERWILEPGDLLYVPPKVGHNGIAVGKDCMTCSVGFRAPSHGDMLKEFSHFVSSDLSEELRYADPDLKPQPHPGRISPEAINQAHQILRQYIEDKDKVAEWFGRSVTIPKYQEEEPTREMYSLKDLQTHLSGGEALLRNEGSRFAFQEHGEEILVFVDGRCFRRPRSQADFVASICAQRVIRFTHLSNTKEDLPFLLELVNHGSLYFPD
ncbi:cupin domain-containing protein [Candidatus Nitronereus thalassa]|uniref:Cupin domain-containing protein n=1 Tax=Candidatus Nitronereus thalassa TaxID=3020898 RepID=A0ABU3KCN1_9BACT|nr:cupin domain-containing protein [Candidatus Nitronereus thalassa]MDT7044053.1 cupin domain-containing protein [Candidatus Nitronereus thalassa]